MSSSHTDEISIALTRPRGGRTVATLLGVFVVAFWWVIVGAVMGKGAEAVVESDAVPAIAVVTAICVALTLVAWRYLAVAFGRRGRLVVGADACGSTRRRCSGRARGGAGR